MMRTTRNVWEVATALTTRRSRSAAGECAGTKGAGAVAISRLGT
jgi:hypothetical protein